GFAASVFSIENNKDSIDIYSGKISDDSTYIVDEGTLFDLASLTKVLSTTLLCAVAINDKKIDLYEEPWPNWPGVKIFHILNHTSGLPAWKPFYREAMEKNEVGTAKGKAIIVEAVLASKLVAMPGQKMVYSDLGFIALGNLLEQRLGSSLDVLFADIAKTFYGPTTLKFHNFIDTNKLAGNNKVASTGNNPWLKHDFNGLVHDPNSFAMGGVAGHAGLFGTLNDVKKAVGFFGEVLRNKSNGVEQILNIFANFQSERPLGFDCVSPDGSTGGVLSGQSVGHLGVTGTSFWVDPLAFNNLGGCFILLSNHVFFGTLNGNAIKKLRQEFHGLAVKSFDD
ncbi:MAG: serine hydrolase, partial [bacterium]|nr:serine hydrolase [bacterium]